MNCLYRVLVLNKETNLVHTAVTFKEKEEAEMMRLWHLQNAPSNFFVSINQIILREGDNVKCLHKRL